ncbi:phosphoethanolamine transferase [Pseudomonas laurentiana]|uniref:Phosphoethanolamine--lipid A transferase n=1 Tax=Pseudomonas laurentiana TaxID=2364649 RepID=A0A6I5RQZ2_9PSED|nr:phosphoethanolamine--lipid A transferase [Pseudomonas laurentiana]NES10101.1 phosphoethanolamine--lipid A transferase [Pseudomonas laurentiana]
MSSSVKFERDFSPRSRSIQTTVLLLLVSLWLTLVLNFTFWRAVWQAVGGWNNEHLLFLFSLPLFVFLWNYLLLNLLAWGRLTRPVLVVVILVSAVASFFMSRYGIVIDYSMVMNVLQTDQAEAYDLLGVDVLLWVLCLGILPAIIVSRVPLTKQRWTRAGAIKLSGMLAALAVIGVILAVAYQSYASLLRNHRDLRLMLVPSNVVGAIHGYAKRQLRTSVAFEQVGLDAVQATDVGHPGRHKVLVLVIGETARAANFSLNGYPRVTNPALPDQGVVSFTNVSSCGTATAISLPCMFLDVGRANYKTYQAHNRDGVLDVLQRAGVAVLWRDNNSGCKGACDRVPSEDVSHLSVPELCNADGCFDEVLLHGLAERIDRATADTVIVLHMEGSHGPAYYKRYPAAFRRFTPTCDTGQLDTCANDAIVNSYDNSLLYTDHVLARLVELLKGKEDRFDTAMLYVSDHGESLGEKGVYLHGLPYAMAPREQTQVPMVVWLSPKLSAQSKVSMGCLDQQRGVTLSHDNLFHSVLGLMKVRTSAYRSELDLFQPCAAARVAVAAEG